VAYVSMLVVGLSSGQLVWAVLPESKAVGWMSVVILGVVGSLFGGLLMGALLHGGNAGHFHPIGVLGSVAGTLVLLGLLHLARARLS
jgi:uncharacterized membrane protein YeaQ/YmgE (transglycosylase-associated protein family)